MTYQPATKVSERLDAIEAAFARFLEHSVWVVWGAGQVRKAPWIAQCGRAGRKRASVSDPSTWRTFLEARRVVEAGDFEGLGIMLGGLPGIAVIDFDKVRDAITGDVSGWAMLILEWMTGRTYSEVSSSGSGFHVFASARDGAPTRTGSVAASCFGGCDGNVEFWQNLGSKNGRFIALTGEIYQHSPTLIGEIDSAIEHLHSHLRNEEKSTPKTSSASPMNDPTSSELEEAVAILKCIPSDIEYSGWLRVIQGIHHRFHGSQLGLQIANEWSQLGAKFKKGDVANRWRGFSIEGGVTWSSVCAIARDNGADLGAIAQAVREAGYTKTCNPQHGQEQAVRLLANYYRNKRSHARVQSPYPVVHVSELMFEEPRYLVDGLIEEGTLIVVFGPPGAGKSFVAQDMAACIATGIDFHGHDCKQGRVIYVIGEGKSGVSRRLKAWAMDHDIALDRAVPLEAVPLAIPMLDPQAVAAVCQSISSSTNAQEPPSLIILDTLARNFGDGDENSTQDMTKFIAAANQLMDAFGCAVLIVHHSGHAAPERGRGSSALKGAADAEFRVKQDAGTKVISLEHTKSKDGPVREPMKLALKSIPLGHRRDGSPFGSAVLVPAQGEHASSRKLPKGTLIAQKTFEDAAVQYGRFSMEGDFLGVSVDDWRTVFKSAHTEKSPDALRQAFGRARKALLDMEHISLEGDVLVFAGEQMNARRLGVAQRKFNSGPFKLGNVETDSVTCHEKSTSRHSGETGEFVTNSPKP